MTEEVGGTGPPLPASARWLLGWTLFVMTSSGVLVLALIGFFFAGCPNPISRGRPGEYSASAPDRARAAEVEIEPDGRDVGGTQFRIAIRPYGYFPRRDLRPRAVVWTATGVRPVYLFWYDDRRLEVLVMEGDRERFASIRSRDLEDVTVVTRAIGSTEFATLMATESKPALVVSPLE